MTIKLGSIEAGGTKFNLARADESGQILQQVRIKTTSPQETLAACRDFFQKYPVDALAISSFGPVDINPHSPTSGYITKTPKPGWSMTDLKGTFEKALKIPVYLTSDVNGSCYGEYVARGRRDDQTYLYLTVGTGIGGGIIQNGHFVGYANHPEMGHMPVIPYPGDDYLGHCPFHGRCVEGMAAGPSLEGRTGIKGEDLPRDHQVFTYVHYYIAQCLFNAYLVARPDVMIVGGSVLGEDDLKSVREFFDKFNNNYVQTPALEDLIVRPVVADNGSATLGNFDLARQLLEK